MWFDRKRGVLIGRGLEVPVPKAAVTSASDGYVRIAVVARLGGFAAESLFVPGFPLGKDHWGQNAVTLRGQVEGVRDALARAWGVRFVKGVPEGPTVDPGVVAYYSDPPQGRPTLEAQSASSTQTTVSCPVRAER